MKQRLWRSIRIGIILFIVLSSGLASYIHWEAAGFDPIREIQRLRNPSPGRIVQTDRGMGLIL